ncbi:phage baseplate assembly protein V [Brenneria uluponensis]|uniref:phage baseplate assembly protein V n=1 Tax=Brenneria uluponensis TaxID=3057057 RepID=UPI0028E85D5E|nr:phage baseplate assembly protein V [Brenneria ulupoensis]
MNEILRLLHNLIRIGVVTDVDLARMVARVETGGLKTDWIRWGANRAGDAVTWWSPSVGEAVVIMAPGGDLATAVIITSLYSSVHPAPSTKPKHNIVTYPDGAVTEYDASIGALKVTGVKTVIVQAAATITLDTPEVICTQHLIAKTFSFTDGGEIRGNVDHAGGALSSNGVVVHTHQHSGVIGGSDNTGGPL